ncbi:MAG: tryptophan--tRNA ligase [Clostridiales bacterium]|nr:tryptophan--tRNA ligase [Clostridiales bacterium]
MENVEQKTEITEPRKRIFSGIQPSGIITLGNYLGAVKNWVNLQDEYDCLYCIVDMHALTVRQEPAKLRQNTMTLAALYLACGLDPEKNIIYVQSQVPAHAELSWILNTFTYMGELNRMTQFKEKSQRHADNINAGLFTYPVLMASDILLYQTDCVPVGEDQRQHLELTRDVAIRFNNIYGDVFKVPTGFIPRAGARIMSLQEPDKKMSKSAEDANSYISMLDDPKVIVNKVKRAVTDSGCEVRFDAENKPGVSNLMNIYSCFTDKTHEEIEKEFEGKGYGDFKLKVGECVADNIGKIQVEYNKIIKDKAYLEGIFATGADRANRLAQRTLAKVKKKVGFVMPNNK